MSNKVITFIGADDYKITTYKWNKHDSGSTQYFHIALKQFYADYTIIVLATDEAKKKHRTALNGFQAPPIGEVVSDEEMWKAFVIIQRQIDPGDHIIFDITHSFRSLPFLALLTIAYLRVVRNFELEAVLYAPYKDYASSPVYDLIRFVDLLDWTTATHLFLKAGYAEDVVQRLELAEWLEANAPQSLQQVAAALRLARPDEARRLAYAWAQLDIEPDDLNPQARPFGLLLKRIQKEFLDIASVQPDQNDLKQELEQELALIDWNLNRGQILSAVTVAREWLVSLFCWLVGWTALNQSTDSNGNVWVEPEWRSGEVRKPGKDMAKAIRKLRSLVQAATVTSQGANDRPTQAACHLIQHDPKTARLFVETWNFVDTLRSDLNHAGKVHTTKPRSLDQIINEVKQLKAQLKNLADQVNLSSPW